jgi:general secretion pathway protein G
MRNADFGVPSGSAPITGFDYSIIGINESTELRTPHSAIRTQKGFSLFELMIAMFILIILLSVAVPVYQRTVQHAKETVLKENLWQMRRAIEQYRADKGRLPAGLEDLVEAKYLREIPVDPVIEKAEWDPQMGEDPSSQEGEQGVVDVKSTAPGQDSDGNPYSGDKY